MRRNSSVLLLLLLLFHPTDLLLPMALTLITASGASSVPSNLWGRHLGSWAMALWKCKKVQTTGCCYKSPAPCYRKVYDSAASSPSSERTMEASSGYCEVEVPTEQYSRLLLPTFRCRWMATFFWLNLKFSLQRLVILALSGITWNYNLLGNVSWE